MYLNSIIECGWKGKYLIFADSESEGKLKFNSLLVSIGPFGQKIRDLCYTDILFDDENMMNRGHRVVASLLEYRTLPYESIVISAKTYETKIIRDASTPKQLKTLPYYAV